MTNCCTEFKFTDKQSIKICLSCIEDLWQKSKEAKQDAEIVIGIRRNNDEVFVITGKIAIEKQKKV